MRPCVQLRRSQCLKNVQTYATGENSSSSEEYKPSRKRKRRGKLSSKVRRNHKELKLWHDNFKNTVGGTSEPSNILNQDFNAISKPNDPIWIGSICFSCENFGSIKGLAAYISNKASAKVVEVAGQLPPLLHFEIVEKKDVWPISFETFPPTNNVIDLYILPVDKRRVAFERLIDDMTHKDIALRAVINGVSVLVFSSLQLTFKYWRTTCGSLYLWAAFLGENAFFSYGVDKHNSIGFFDSMPSYLAIEVHSSTECQRNVDTNIHSEQVLISDETCGDATFLAIPIALAETQPDTAESLDSSCSPDVGGALILHGGNVHDNIEAPSDTCLQKIVPSAAIELDSTERTCVDKYPIGATEGVIREETCNGAIDVAIAIEFRETQPNTTQSSHRLDQSSAEDIYPSFPHHALILLDTYEDDLLDSKAPSNFPNATLQSASKEQVACSSEKLWTSVVDMASTFNDGAEEISSADNCKEQVGSYFVNPRCAPILRAIIEKHGDIAKDYPVKSSKMLTFALEMVCEAVRNLEAGKFADLRKSQLQSLHSAIADAELVKLDVKWLRNRYSELSEAVDLIKEYKDLKASRRNMRKMIAKKKNGISLRKIEIFKLECEILTLERQIDQVKAKTKNIKNVKAKCKHFGRNLLDGLL